MFQTADADNYADMIAVTSMSNRHYCEMHGIAFESFRGIKRGFHPWHACFNRIVYLKEQIDAGYSGWVFYVDADAFVFDHDFDVRRIIADGEGDYYFAPGDETGEKWDVNDGVFLIDLGSEAGKALVRAWHDHFMETSEEALRDACEWETVPSDQPRLHEILRTSPDLLDRLVHVPREVLNNEKASFVRHVLRSNAETLEDRLARLRGGVAQTMIKVLGAADGTEPGSGGGASSARLADLSAPEALGLAHGHAVQDQLHTALAMAQLALSKPAELGEQEANARVLAASLLERQGRLEEAAWMIARAKALAPEDDGIAADQQRILASLERQSA